MHNTYLLAMIADDNYLDEESQAEGQIRRISMHALMTETDGNNVYAAIDSPASCPTTYGGASGMTLREQDDQLQMLRKENFHLKLRIYFLQQAQSPRGNVKTMSIFENSPRQVDNEKVELRVIASNIF